MVQHSPSLEEIRKAKGVGIAGVPYEFSLNGGEYVDGESFI